MKKILVIVLSVLMLVTVVVTEGFCFDSSYDLRNYGVAPAVENQGSDNTCWTFSTMAALESNYLFKTTGGEWGISQINNFLGSDSNLSELHLAWFSFKNPDNKKNFAYVRNGSVIQPSDSQILNHAGNPQMALAFLSRQDGPVRESALPYGSAYPAAGTSPRDYKLALRVIRANYIDPINFSMAELVEGSSEDVFIGEEDLLKTYLLLNGAVSIGVYWDSTYMSSNYSYYNPNSRKGGHAVTIIGWDDNYSRDNFVVKPERDGAWLVQNSWGTSWGNDGYFWMSYEQLLRFAIAFDVEEANPRVREYYHDDLGFTHEISFADTAAEKTVGVANIFKVKGDHEKLREIGFYSTNSEYDAATLVLDMGTDNSLEKFASLADDNILDNTKGLDFFEGVADRGYIVNLLDKPVALSKDHYFAILTIMTPSSEQSEDFKPTIAAEVKIPNYRTANAEINANETYFSTDGDNWKDAKYHTFNVGANEITGFNACIKGFSYVPDERFADDWTLVSQDGKAQLSISLLKETEPTEIIVKGYGIDNVLHKVELENASAGDAKGNFYTLKLICDMLASNDARLTSLKINGEEVLTGSIRNIKYKTDFLREDRYIDISKVGVSFKDMTQASGAIESTDGYANNSDNSSGNDNKPDDSKTDDNTPDDSKTDDSQPDDSKTDDNNNNTVIRHSGGSSSGCNSGISVLTLIILSSALVLKRKAR